MILYILPALLATVFLGWSLGPLVEWLGDKVSNSESAKKSEQESIRRYDKNANGYDKTNNDWIDPVASEDSHDRFYYTVVFVFFVSLIGFVMTGHRYFIYSTLVCMTYFYFNDPPYLIPPSR